MLVLLVTLPVAAPIAAAQSAKAAEKKPSTLELVQTAHTLFVQGDFEGARKYYLEVLPQFPKDFDILKNLGFCYYSTGPRGYAQAANYYARAYALKPDSKDLAEKLSDCYMTLHRYSEAGVILRKLAAFPDAPPESWKKAAEAFDAARQIPEAESAYDAYLQRNPGDLDARSNLGRLYSWEKDYARALEQFRMVLSSNPNFSPALVGEARILSWEGKYEESLPLYERVLRLNPGNGEAESGKAFILLWIGRTAEAAALFSKLHQRFPQDPEISSALDTAQAALDEKTLSALRLSGDTAKLETYYRQRLEKNPKDLIALKSLVGFTADPKRCSESIGFARTGLELSPHDSGFEYLLARSLALCQQYPEAIARFRRYLETQPKSEDAAYELGQALLRTGQIAEAIDVFRNLLRLNPKNSDGRLGLAHALSASGNYTEALLLYNQALKSAPEDYDALQGKAFILYYQHDFEGAAAIFKRLAELRPTDPQNSEALLSIAGASEDERWAALRPPPGAPPQTFLDYFQKRLEKDPKDETAIKGRAYVLSQLNDRAAAIRAYQEVVEKYPDDLGAKKELARLLSVDGQYPAAIGLYQDVLKSTPADLDALESLARIYLWSGRHQDSLHIYQGLLARNPSNLGYQLEVARLELSLKDYGAARESFAAVLSADPKNREAQLQLAQMDLNQGSREDALKRFNTMLAQNPKDPEALLGKAQISYYQGDIPEAQAACQKLVDARPDNFEAVFLLANIEHARRNRRATLALLDRADRISPGNPEVTAMKQRVREETAVTIHTSATYGREIGPRSGCTNPAGCGQLDLHEDLRTYTYGTTIGMSLLPRTDSYLSFTSLPSESPLGRNSAGVPIALGLSGTVAPKQFLYRQTTRLSPRFTVRAGAGLERFGPGELRSVAGIPLPVTTATVRPLGQGGFSFFPTAKFSVDVDVTRSAIDYSPTAVRLGVIEDRFTGRLNYFFTPRTEIHLEYYYGHFSSISFNHLINGSQAIRNFEDHDQGNAGNVTFNRNFVRSSRVSFDAGYTGLVEGFAGPRRRIFMGFFNPKFYQRHLLTAHASTTLFGPVGFDFSGGIGLQQTGQGNAVTRALNVSPAFTFKLGRRLALTLGYTHYSTSQALGPLKGNGVRVATDWKL